MRDIIWTLILIWITWKIIAAIKTVSKAPPNNLNDYAQNQRRPEGEVKIDTTASNSKSHFKENDGEYVEYEEIK